MRNCTSSKLKTASSAFNISADRRRAGFTLLEVVMAMILLAIISSISIPYFAGSFRGIKLRSAARTIERMSRYGRNMAIMREETLTMVLNNKRHYPSHTHGFAIHHHALLLSGQAPPGIIQYDPHAAVTPGQRTISGHCMPPW